MVSLLKVSAAKPVRRDCGQTFSIKEVLDHVLNGGSDPEGMSSSEESELDRELKNESIEWR